MESHLDIANGVLACNLASSKLDCVGVEGPVRPNMARLTLALVLAVEPSTRSGQEAVGR